MPVVERDGLARRLGGLERLGAAYGPWAAQAYGLPEPQGLAQANALPQALVVDDYAANVRTTGRVAVGGSSTGVLEVNRDRDWFAVDLTANRTYALRETGVTLSDPLLRLRSATGALLASNDDAEGTFNSLIRYTPTASGRFYLEAGAFNDSLTGSYRVSVADVTPAPPPPPVDDFAAAPTTTGSVAVGGSRNGTLEVLGDHDWFSVAVTAGRTYGFQLNGISLADPTLVLRDGAGVQLAANDDASSTTRNSLITYTASATTTLYLDAGAFANAYTGTYTVVATDLTPPPPPVGFSSVDGYGEANVARALDLLTGLPLPRQAPLGGVFWGLDRVGAPSAWAAGVTGAGITVAVVDTGVDATHPDLAANMWTNPGEIAGNGLDDDNNGFIDDSRGWDFASNDNDPMDLNGHGTHVAGTIAAANDGSGQTGVAYGARIMPVRVLDAAGRGTYAAIANGVRYATANGARVINLSLGGGTGSPDLQLAIQEAAARGVVVVMAAGNDGAATVGYPAAYATTVGLAAGAVDINGTLASFSNRAGSTPLDYVTAPGVNVYSTLPGNAYGYLSGTSMATPHLAGLAALILSYRPALTAAQVEALLTASASHGSGVFTA